MSTEQYQFIDSPSIAGRASTVHIPNSAYIRLEWVLDQFVSDRANLEVMRGFESTVRFEDKILCVRIDVLYVYWNRVSAEDGVWYEPREIIPIWHEAHLYNKEYDELPHDFDLNVIINRLTTH